MLLILFIGALSAETIKMAYPPKPGFYGVNVLDNGELEYVELEQHIGKRLASDPVAAWDFRKVTGSTTIQTVRDQGQCGACWAFSASDVAGAALYLNTQPHVDKTFSPQYLINCRDVEQVGEDFFEQLGCGGGYPIIAFVTIVKNFHVEDDCLPWEGDPGNRSTCPTKCKDGSSLKKQAFPQSTYQYFLGYRQTVQELKDIITTSGPCSAQMMAYEDLGYYTGGVYTSNKKEELGAHIVTVYGFGTQGGKDYWLVKNSWGTSWGESGFFKIRMGFNESGIEDCFFCLVDRRTQANYNYPGISDPIPDSGGGGSDPTDEDKKCNGIPVDTDCVANTSCKWYIPDDTTTYAPFCDVKIPTCRQFDPINCDPAKIAALYPGLVCSLFGGKCAANANDAEIECSYYTKNGGKDTCANTYGCKWFTNEVDSDEFCDDENINCTNFRSKDYCGISYKWRQTCVWDIDTSGNAPACSASEEAACVALYGCQWVQNRTRDPWECLYKGECVKSVDCSPYLTAEMCEDVLGCDWKEGSSIVNTIGTFIDPDAVTGQCVAASGMRLAVPFALILALLLTLLFL